jgi:hypothetical protein
VLERERRDGRGMCLFCGARFAVDAGTSSDGPLRSQALVALRQVGVPQPASVQRVGDDHLVIARVKAPLVTLLVTATLLGAAAFLSGLPLSLQIAFVASFTAILGVMVRVARGEQELVFSPGKLELSKWQVLRTQRLELSARQIAGAEIDSVQRAVLRLTDGRAVLVGLPGEGPWLVDELQRRGLAGSGKDRGGDGSPGDGHAA